MTPRRARPRHVTFVDAYAHLYAGAERSIHLVAERLPERGYSVDVVLTREGIFADRLRASGVPVTIVPAPAALSHYGETTTGTRVPRAIASMPGYWRDFYRHVHERPGVVHGCSQRITLLAAPPARAAGARYLWQVSVIEEHHAVSRACDLLANRIVGLAHVVRVPSLIPGRRMDIVPMPLDPRFDDVTPVEPADPPTIVTVGRIEPMKNFPLLIEAAAIVRRRFPELRVRIIGAVQEGHEEYAAQLLAQRDRLGLTDHVEFTGWAEHPEQLWQGASVYVQPSVREGQGIAPIEAMACSLPVVITSPIGLAEIVQDGVDAMVVPPGDVGAFASAIERLLDDRELARKIGAAGRERALTYYALDRIVDLQTAVYDEMLAP